MATIGEDCYFYYNSTCARGDSCTYRHQPAARTTTEICQNWLKGSCFKPSCTLRHTVASLQSSSSGAQPKIQCYWESQPSGCLKQNCPYFHAFRNSSLAVGTPPANTIGIVPAVLPPSGGLGIVNNLPNIQVAASPFVPAVQPLPVNALNVGGPGAIFIGRGLTVLNQASPLIAGPALLRGRVPNLASPMLPTSVVSSGAAEISAPTGLLNSQSSGATLREDMQKVIPRGGTIHVKPSIARLMTPQLQPSHGYSSVLGPAPDFMAGNSAPIGKAEHFGEQVRLFKELLATKAPAVTDSKAGGSLKSVKESFSPDCSVSDGWSDEEAKGSPRDKRPNDIRRVERQREKLRKRRHERRGHEHGSLSKHRRPLLKSRSGMTLSKADQELLEGDYKDIPLDRVRRATHRKRAPTTHSDSELNLHIKSLEEVLRDKATKKNPEKKVSVDSLEVNPKDDSVSDVREVTSPLASNEDVEIGNRKGSVKRSSKSEVPNVDLLKKKDMNLESASKVYTGYDGGQMLPLNGDLDNHAPESDPISVYTVEKGKQESMSPNGVLIVPEEVEESGNVSEGTDVSLDVPDEEIQSLHLPYEDLPTEVKASARARSSKTRARKSSDRKSPVRYVNDRKRVTTVVPHDEVPSREHLKATQKRNHSSEIRRSRNSKVRRVGGSHIEKDRSPAQPPSPDRKPSEAEKSAPNDALAKVENKTILKGDRSLHIGSSPSKVKPLIDLPLPPKAAENRGALPPQKPADVSMVGSKVHVKSFEEIMAEKRRRKFGAPEVHVISDDGDTSDVIVDVSADAAKKPGISLTNLRAKSDAAKASVLSRRVTTLPSSRAGPRFNTTQMSSVEALASNEREKRVKFARKSIQLYKPPLKDDGSLKSASGEPHAAAEPGMVSKKSRLLVARTSKPADGSSPAGKPVDDQTSKTDAMKLVHIRRRSSENHLPGGGSVQVKSFADIMHEKRLRRQLPASESSTAPLESRSFTQRRHRFLKKPISQVTSETGPEKLTTVQPTTSRVAIVARVLPFSMADDEEPRLVDSVAPSNLSQTDRAADNRWESLTPLPADYEVEVSVNSDDLFRRRLRVAERELSKVPLSTDSVVSNIRDVVLSVEQPSDRPTFESCFTSPVAPDRSASHVHEHIEYPATAVRGVSDFSEPTSLCTVEDAEKEMENRRRQPDEDLLSDEELKKEFDDLSSVGDEEIDEDDLMMEIEGMIGDD